MSSLKKEICKRGHNMSITRKMRPNGDTYCYECKKIRTQQYKIKHPGRHLEYYKISHRRKTYHLEPHEYDKLIQDSNNLCMICKSPPGQKSLHIDHDHKTGKVRGLLCHGCNTAIGHMKDDVNILTKAIEYLKRK
jgi:hypothetical protein